MPEINPEGAPVPFTYYPRPGLTPLIQCPDATTVRGVYRASNGQGYVVCGQSVYQIGQNWMLTLLGELAIKALTPVSMIDNATTLVLVDNSQYGYTIDLATGQFAQINDSTGTFQGATKVDYIDTFVLWNMPDTENFGSTLSNEITFDALYFGSKTDYPDPLVTLVVNRHEIVLLGALKSEIWYDAGNAQFPFAELPGAYIEHGCVAPFSAASSDISVFWLGLDLQGQGVVFRQRGYETTRISNHAVEYAIRQMAQSGTIADAIGYTHQQDGHYYYVLTFPTGDQTWAFDDSISDPRLAWHQRAWADANGVLHRDRTNCHAFINSTHVVGDWQNGWLYALDPLAYTDVGAPIPCVRTFQHSIAGEFAFGPNKIPVRAEGRRIRVKEFSADIESGTVPLDAQGNPAVVSLRMSMDRGRTWSDYIAQSLGAPGDYTNWPTWKGVNLISRDPLFELSWSAGAQVTLNGAWMEADVLET